MSYASGTEVPVERSKAEVEKIIGRYGASGFMYATSALGAVIMFEAQGRRIRMGIPMPDKKDLAVTDRGHTRTRTDVQLQQAFEQAQRARWRSLVLVVKAKLEATASGVATFEQEFLPYIVLPNKKGQTVGEWLLPQVEEAYRSNIMPSMLNLGAASKA